MITFDKKYFYAAAFLFIIEVLIARYVNDRIIRPYVGDFIVVILIYCLIRSFVKLSVYTTAAITLIFAYTIETLQYFNIVSVLGLEHNKIARTVIGSSFEWIDLVAYTLGVFFVIGLEAFYNKPKDI